MAVGCRVGELEAIGEAGEHTRAWESCRRSPRQHKVSRRSVKCIAFLLSQCAVGMVLRPSGHTRWSIHSQYSADLQPAPDNMQRPAGPIPHKASIPHDHTAKQPKEEKDIPLADAAVAKVSLRRPALAEQWSPAQKPGDASMADIRIEMGSVISADAIIGQVANKLPQVAVAPSNVTVKDG